MHCPSTHKKLSINSSFSDWKGIRIEVPQGSDLGPLLLNILINDISIFEKYTKICNYADDTRIFACHPDFDIIVRQLEIDSSVMVKWFSGNFLKLKAVCHVSDWPLQSEFNTTDFFVNLCI